MAQTSEVTAGQPARAEQPSLWRGGVSPLQMANLKLGMWLFLATDTLTFGSFLAGYGVLRLASPNWPDPDQHFNIWLVTAMTFILICSSATMAVAVGAARRGDRTTAIRFLVLTIIGGLFFLGAQAYEWTHLIEAGARLIGNPWGDPLFTTSFFVITGFHGLHVSVGVIYLALVALAARRGRYSGVGVESAGLYWHFVDLVWVFIFTLFYLL